MKIVDMAMGLATFLSLAALATGAKAQTIYPLDRAEILAGARFDLKVEFDGAPAEADVSVTINGQKPAEVISQPATFAVKEDGADRSAFWVRDATLSKPGIYKVEARHGDKVQSVTWEVFATPERKAKNVILFIGDGMSIAHRTAARILSKGIKQGRYGGELSIDDMPYMALVSTAGTDSIITDSANSMSAYATGHKSCVNALGVYCSKSVGNFDQPKVETIAELAKRQRGMSVGIVTNTEIEDATPAGMIAHTRRRSEFNEIVRQMYDARPEVVLGGGLANFLPKGAPGSRRLDEKDYVELFKQQGYAYAATLGELKSALSGEPPRRLLGLFNTSNIDGALDRRILKHGTVPKFPDQPDLVDQVDAALKVLSRADNGFVLMVESGRIDKYSHSLDWERAVYDTIMLDNAVAAAKKWAEPRGDTLVIVVADHAHPVSLVGTYDDDTPGQTPREKLGVYEHAAVPNYPAADAEGYPPTVDVSRRLAIVFGAHPDYCDDARPHLEGENVPTELGPGGYVARDFNCKKPGAVRVPGNLPFKQPLGVHSGDDVLLTAMGPGAEAFHGRIDNTRVFRAMATALGLSTGK